MQEVDSKAGDYTVRGFEPSDATGIRDLFKAVYGDGYPISVFYDPDGLTEANNKGEYYSIVASNVDGRIVGIQHLFRSAPNKRLYEAGAGAVLKEFRGSGINNEMLRYVYDECAPAKPDIDAVFGEAVCNHIIMQKAVSRFKHDECALEIALMPAEAYVREKSAPGRVAGLLAFRSYKPRPHTVFLPQTYEEPLRFLYAGIKESRELRTASGAPQGPPTEWSSQVFDFAKVMRVTVNHAGPDFADVVTNLESVASEKGVVVIQVWLKLTEPWVGAVVDRLRSGSYFFGGLLPRWFDDDGLLMQKIVGEPYFDSIMLHTDRSHKILEIIRNDYKLTGGG
jgi:hypothetical protein